MNPIMHTPTELFKAAWEAVMSNLKTFAIISLITSVLIVILMLVFGLEPQELEDNNWPSLPEIFFIITSSIVGVIANIVIIKALAEPELSRDKQILSFAFATFFPYIWVSVLVGLAVLGGFVLLIIPGIFLAVALSFSNFIVVLEGVKGSDALKQSYGYVKGRWFAIFGRYAFLILIALLFMIPFSILTAIMSESSYLGMLFTGFVSILASCVSNAYAYFMYVDVRTVPATVSTETGNAPHSLNENQSTN